MSHYYFPGSSVSFKIKNIIILGISKPAFHDLGALDTSPCSLSKLPLEEQVPVLCPFNRSG